MKLFKLHPKPWSIELIREDIDPDKYDGNFIITDADGREVVFAGNNSNEQEINMCSVSAVELVNIINKP